MSAAQGPEAASQPPAPAPAPSPPTHEQYRQLYTSRQFTLQLELVNSLASPAYLYHLTLTPPGPGQVAPLSQPTFVRYLAHIHSIWSKPEYAKFVQYPNGLYFCRLLVESPEFRQAVGSQEWENETSERLIEHWASWRREGGADEAA
ncbi:hypothetical protein BDZ90DRAFT_257598 [Jaminaea rosea]|uniref:Mediator of RNA polymerase II transcription subunit 31 n=1 Tax=Jaminaea rosea TaxID=1569628 RepID=A0A316V0J8_9BASI|nr:hypothetical protein BDZ90DRAFT_257598 [Jaminaea rosea]PWN30518.1 hypothetical protein BDZ90DRAFT_257598 [Jaminaea rosea]